MRSLSRLAAVVVGLACGIAVAAGPGAAVRATAPASQPVLDPASPQAAVVSFFKAAVGGEASAARAAAILRTAQDERVVDGLCQFLGSFRQMRKAAVAKFGIEAMELIPDHSFVLVHQASRATAKVEGDRAVVNTPGNAIILRRVEDRWRVDVAEMTRAQDMARQLPAMEAATRSLRSITSNIESGRYAKLADLRQAIETAMAPLQKGDAPPGKR